MYRNREMKKTNNDKEKKTSKDTKKKKRMKEQYRKSKRKIKFFTIFGYKIGMYRLSTLVHLQQRLMRIV
jgi:hypothetical protein